jgi:hypothetical protein
MSTKIVKDYSRVKVTINNSIENNKKTRDTNEISFNRIYYRKKILREPKEE